MLSGLINGDDEIVVRHHFDKISVTLPTYLILSTLDKTTTKRQQLQLKPNTVRETYGSSVFKLRSVQFGDHRVSVQSTWSPLKFVHFQVNPLERSYLKIDIKAQYVETDVQGEVFTR